MDDYKEIIIMLLVLILIVILTFSWQNKYNTEEHSDDITMTEWISPDGVHYWLQKTTYQAMLAPRYDAEGNLVIDEVK